jgi:hypothetical protein
VKAVPSASTRSERRALRLFTVVERLAPVDTGDPASIVSGAARVRPSQLASATLSVGMTRRLSFSRWRLRRC